jgi:hypothetical protein
MMLLRGEDFLLFHQDIAGDQVSLLQICRGADAYLVWDVLALVKLEGC